jgi:hypothetical protein
MLTPPPPRAAEEAVESGGLFGVSLAALARRRACPPPLIAELEHMILTHDEGIRTASGLAQALDAAVHPSMRQQLDAVIAALDAHGASHGGLANALAAARSQAAPALGLGAMFHLLHRLPIPAIPCECYALVLSAGASTIAPLLRKRLPPLHAALVDAVGKFFGRVLLRCGILAGADAEKHDAGTSDADAERALHALLIALTPALLRPTTDAPTIPPAERAAATRATRALLRYHVSRELLRAHGGGTGVGSRGMAARAVESEGASSAAAATPFGGAGPVDSHSATQGVAAALLLPRAAVQPMDAVAAAIMRLFEREFGGDRLASSEGQGASHGHAQHAVHSSDSVTKA